MHAYLIVGNSEGFIKGLGGKIIEFPFAKIGDVRELSNFTRLKVTQKTVIVLNDFDKASEEAQNAFLKSLEEPQENLIYVLTAGSLDKILSTIVSRCEVREFGVKNYELSKEDEEKVLRFINGEISEKLLVLSKITKRDEAIDFVKKMLAVIHGDLAINNQWQTAEAALTTLKNLESNGNVTLQLTKLILS